MSYQMFASAVVSISASLLNKSVSLDLSKCSASKLSSPAASSRRRCYSFGVAGPLILIGHEHAVTFADHRCHEFIRPGVLARNCMFSPFDPKAWVASETIHPNPSAAAGVELGADADVLSRILKLGVYGTYHPA